VKATTATPLASTVPTPQSLHREYVLRANDINYDGNAEMYARL